MGRRCRFTEMFEPWMRHSALPQHHHFYQFFQFFAEQAHAAVRKVEGRLKCNIQKGSRGEVVLSCLHTHQKLIEESRRHELYSSPAMSCSPAGIIRSVAG